MFRLNQSIISINERIIKHMGKQVYCTECANGKELINATIDDTPIPEVCNGCYPYDIEDSRDIELRDEYIPIKISIEDNIKILIQRYKNKIEWLETRPDSQGSIDSFETIMYDLKDLLDGLDM